MGTSQSSNGPGSGVSLIPPWADELPASGLPSDEEEGPPRSAEVAQPRRFGSTRTYLGRFARDGHRDDLRRSLGHYVSSGYGGAASASRRMASTARTAGRLSELLARSTETANALFERLLAESDDATVLLEAIIEATRPVDGTFDAEASRRSLWDALSELLTAFPEADLAHLTDVQQWFAIERFVALDVYNLFCRDMLKTLFAKAPDHTTGLTRLSLIESYITEVVAASLRGIRETDSPRSGDTVSHIVAQSLSDTFAVFESYL